MREQIYKVQSGLCFYCDKPIELHNTVLDHLLPRARGGRDDAINRVGSCRDCDAHKQARMPTKAEIAKQAEIRGRDVSVKVLSRTCRDWSALQPRLKAEPYTWETVVESPLWKSIRTE